MINDRYKIKGKAGEGRSTVFLCEDTLKKNSRLAIKILPSAADKEEKKAFRNEYFLLQKLNHPNIISVFDYGIVVSTDKEDIEFNINIGSPFFTLEYFEGVELYEAENINSETLLIEIICQISSVLYYLHQSFYIYYDLKSENILVKETDNRPVIKFIDFGLTARGQDASLISARGTSEYIAPEILRKEKIDHRIDLYSFGILLYKILYNKFPFAAGDQLGIYKAHLNEQFEFPPSVYSEKIIDIIKNLLSKVPGERYYTSIGIIQGAAPEKLNDFRKDWNRVWTFTARKDAFSIISTFIEKEDGGEVITIKGAEGAGKSTLLREINFKYPYSFILSADHSAGRHIWQSLLISILHRENIYPRLEQDLINDVKRLIEEGSKNLVEELKTVIIKLISAGTFILMIDNFNLMSDIDLEILIQLIPILQVNKIKVVLTEDSSREYRSKALNSLRVINLNPFTETEVAEFVQNSFAEFYPADNVKKAIVLYSDLLPGNIEIFLKDLIVLDILRFEVNGPVIRIDKNMDEILKGGQEDIYKYRIENLDPESRDLAILLSLFNINLDIKSVSLLTGRPEHEVSDMLVKLSESNIIHFNPVQAVAQYTSRGIKDYVYSTIENVKETHLWLAELISDRLPDFNKNELAQHWEAAGEHERSYQTLKEELISARNASALAYERNVLEHLCSLQLKDSSLREIKLALSNCLFQIGEQKASLELMEDLLANPHFSEAEITYLKILKGKALISNQDLEEGKKLLESILSRIEGEDRRNEILAEITEANLDMARYDEAEVLANKLIADQNTSVETKGKVYRIKGLVDLYRDNNPGDTLLFFQYALKEYQKNKQLAKVASMQNNLGNVYNILGERELAENHWDKALDTNSSIGNLLQNAIILLNLGIYNFDLCNYEKAIKYYREAESFFKTLGDRNNLGITYINLGEVYLVLCEYEKSLNALNRALEIFEQLNKKVELKDVEFLMGRLFYSLGDIDDLRNVIQKYSENSLKLEKYEFNLKYLNLLYELLERVNKETNKKLIALRDNNLNFSDNNLFCEIQIQIIEELIISKQYQNAEQELNNENFVNICVEHIYYNAYRNYLLGRILRLAMDEKSGSYIDYYNKAYELINEISITELTWKVLFDLYLIYSERGNVSRMNEYKNYTKQTLNYITSQFKSAKLRKIYLNKPERRNAVNLLEVKV